MNLGHSTDNVPIEARNPLRVSKLIAMLTMLPQDAWVVVEGYETGYDPILSVEWRKLSPRLDGESYDGVLEDEGVANAIECIVLGPRHDQSATLHVRRVAATRMAGS